MEEKEREEEEKEEEESRADSSFEGKVNAVGGVHGGKPINSVRVGFDRSLDFAP